MPRQRRAGDARQGIARRAAGAGPPQAAAKPASAPRQETFASSVRLSPLLSTQVIDTVSPAFAPFTLKLR
jgi:hypothetical protein